MECGIRDTVGCKLEDGKDLREGWELGKSWRSGDGSKAELFPDRIGAGAAQECAQVIQ